MPRGLTMSQVGVSESMIETYGDAIWNLSNNMQIRRGDPVRTLAFDQVEAQRPLAGMSDQQIADRLGLSRDQVLLIRVLLEARRFDRQRYYRLYELGGGRRFREERFVPHEQRGYSGEAMELRDGIRFDPDLVRRYVDAGWWADDTLGGWLRERAIHNGTAPATVMKHAAITYSELRDNVERLASGLYHLGIRAGDVVTIQLPNIPEFVIAYLAISRLGAVMSTAHMPYRGAELRTLLSHGRARAFIGLGRGKDVSPTGIVSELKNELPLLQHIVSVGEPVVGTISWASLMSDSAPLPDSIAAVPSDPFLLLFTSGTSASPKAVPLTYQATLGNARMGAPEHRITASDRILSAAPYTHLFGLYSFHLALSVGATNTLLPMFTPSDLAAALNELRPTVLFTAPAHLAAMLGSGALGKAEMASLRLIICSGSACSPDLARQIAALLTNGRFTQLWGMTETQAGLYTRPDDPVETSATTAGRPSPGTEVRIVDSENKPLPDGKIGELQIRGSLLFPGYFANDAANRDAFTQDRWFRTGDLATRDSAGNIGITGRIKELINRGGIKYNPRDVEELIAQHSKVSQVAIIPIPDEVLGEKACCFLVAKGGTPPSLEELCAFLVDHGIAKHKLPERLVVVDEMPMTPTRKIIKGKLKDLL